MMTTAQLRAEFQLARKKLQANPNADLHKELVLNVYPCLEALVEHVQEQDRALQEFEDSDSYILPDMAQLLLATFMSVDALITEARKTALSIDDDIQKKRLLDLAEEAEKLCAESAIAVNEASVEYEGEGEEEEESDEDDEEEEDNEDDEEAEG